MAEEKEVKVKVDIDAEPSLAQLRALKKALKDTTAGSAEFKKISNAIRDVEDAIEESKAGAEDFLGTIEKTPGPLGALGKGIRQVEIATSSFGNALKATGIGLITAAVAGLVAVFAKQEGAMKKLEPIMIGFEKILGGIFRALEPLIDSFVELAGKVMPYVTKGIGIFYSALVGLFTYIKEAGTGVGKIIKGIFTFDADKISEGVDQLKNSFATAVKSGTEAYARFEVGSNELTATEKKNNAERTKNNKDAADAAKKAAQDQINANENLQQSNDELALSEKKKSADAIQAIKDEQAYKKKEFDREAARLDALMALEKKGSVEYKNILAEKTKLQADYNNGKADSDKKITEEEKKLADENLKNQKEYEKRKLDIKLAAIEDELQRALQTRERKYNEDLAALEADKEFIKKSEEEKELLRKALKVAAENDASKLRKDAKIKEMNEELVLLQAQGKALEQGTQAYFDNARAIEETAYKIKKEKAKGNATELEAIEAEHSANMINIAKTEQEAKIALMNKGFDAAIGLAKGIQQIAQGNKGIAKAAIRVEQALTTGKIVMNDLAAIRKAYAANPLGFGLPWSAFYAADMIVGVVAANQSANQAISALDKDAGGATAGGGASTSAPTGSKFAKGGILVGPSHSEGGIKSPYGELEGGEFVINKRSTKSFMPLLSAINSAGNRKYADGGLAASVSSLQDMFANQPTPIVKTYVVASDMTNQMEADFKIKQLARL